MLKNMQLNLLTLLGEVLMNWWKLAKVMGIDPEEDWEQADEADQVFQQVGIRYDRNKNVSQVAMEDGAVIGALASGWSRGESHEGKEVDVFSFDLVVRPEHRRRGVGLKLIEQAIQSYESDKHAYEEIDHHTMMRLWVVNPVLVPLLENSFQFQIESNGSGGAHLVRY
jgi:GNAT superfamily N-acetyltransferase